MTMGKFCCRWVLDLNYDAYLLLMEAILQTKVSHTIRGHLTFEIYGGDGKRFNDVDRFNGKQT